MKEVEAMAYGIYVKVMKREDDPLCLRVSVGGDKVNGLYFVYRGDLKRSSR